jgi:hypothetical protein
MALTGKKVAEYIVNNFSAPIANLDSLIVEAHEMLLDTPPSEVRMAEILQDIGSQVRHYLGDYIDRCNCDGLSPRFSFGVTTDTLINKQAQLHTAKASFLAWVSALDPYQFEKFCTKILEIEGCKNISVTSPSHDGGVDFYGTKEISVLSEGDLSFFKDVEVLVLGQAKKYTTKIGVDHIRDFIGSSQMASTALYKGAPVFLPTPIKFESFKPHAPSLLIYVTSGEVNDNARQLAKWLGIKLIDGDRIVDIFYSKDIALRRLSNEVVFDRSELDKFVGN